VVAVFNVSSELSLPICQAMIEHIFSLSSVLDAHAADALSVALLNAVKTAVEKDQAQGLELLITLDSTLTDKVRRMPHNSQ
jgi:mediator of RNA polymerase II transcription subunit 12